MLLISEVGPAKWFLCVFWHMNRNLECLAYLVFSLACFRVLGYLGAMSLEFFQVLSDSRSLSLSPTARNPLDKHAFTSPACLFSRAPVGLVSQCKDPQAEPVQIAPFK